MHDAMSLVQPDAIPYMHSAATTILAPSGAGIISNPFNLIDAHAASPATRYSDWRFSTITPNSNTAFHSGAVFIRPAVTGFYH
ncbi:hypothetical protein BASA62_007609 [Batrachochytrium salamandrivorans]|nr:hypothetical protein BASA62_007609 [Batrachochytrium salamandrivorans]